MQRTPRERAVRVYIEPSGEKPLDVHCWTEDGCMFIEQGGDMIIVPIADSVPFAQALGAIALSETVNAQLRRERGVPCR